MTPMPLFRPHRPLGLAALTLACSLAWSAAPSYDDAQARFDKGDVAGAIVQLKAVLQKEPRMLAAHLLLAKALLRSGAIKAAEAEFEEALRLGVSRAEVALPLGRAYLMMGETRKLVDTISPNELPGYLQAEVLTLRGSAFAMMGDRAQAARSFEQGMQADPEAPGPRVGDALLKLRNGDSAGALAAATRATELAPKNVAAWETLGKVQRARGDDKAARTAFDQALGLDTANVDVRIARAGLALGEGRDADAAKDLDLLTKGGIADPRASYLRAVLAGRQGDAKAARQAYADVVDQAARMAAGVLNGDESTLLAAALAHQALGDAERAREQVKALLLLAPRHYAGQLLAASLALDARDWSAAQGLLDGLYRAMPDDPAVLNAMGNLSLGRRNYAQAASFFEKALGKQPSPQALRDLGLSQLGLGNDRRGIELLEQSLAKNPGDVGLALRLAMIQGAQGNGARALELAETARRSAPDDMGLLAVVGNIRGRAGDKAGARAAFEAVLKKDPKAQVAAVSLNWLDIEERRFDAARARLAPMLKAAGRDADLLFQRGVLEYRAGKDDDAIGYLEKAMELRPSDPRAGLALIELLRKRGELARALSVSKTLAAQNPNDLASLLAAADVHIATGDAVRARATLRDAARLAQGDPDRLVTIGRMQLAAGGADDTAYTLQKLQQLRPGDLGAMVLQVELDFRSQNRAKAEADLKALNQKHPGALPTLLTNGHAAMGWGQYAAAAKHYQAAFDKAPDSASAVLLAQAQMAAGQPAAALRQLGDWSAKRPQDRAALIALAELQTRAGQLPEAKASYGRLVQLDPDAAPAWIAFAQALARAKDPAARATAEKAVKLAPTDAAALATLGSIQVQDGQLDAGIANLRDARLRKPNAPEIHLQLAAALARAGRKQEAGDELRAAMALDAALAKQPAVKTMRQELGI